MNTSFSRRNLHIAAILASLCPALAIAEAPILTDEFDAFLVTKESAVGEVIGQIEPVFPNDLKPTWSLEKPIPGGDRRNYLKEGQ